jgi:hypothetical protein
MANKYDRIIKENIKALAIPLLHGRMGIEKAELLALPPKIQRTLEREMDSLLKVTSHTGEVYILNVEWQVKNDSTMCTRMLLYNGMTRLAHKLPVRGFVIYIGAGKMNMPALIDEPHLRFSYDQIDLKELNPEHFLASHNPEEIILAVLAGRTEKGEKTVVIERILFKLRALLSGDEPKLQRTVAQLEIIGELGGVQEIIKEEELKMAFTYNIKNDIRYKEGLEVGIEKTGAKKDRTFVLSLLRHFDLSDQKIAEVAEVPLDFVQNIRNKSVSKKAEA